MSFRFKKEDFEYEMGHIDGVFSVCSAEACDIANQLLDEYLATLPEVAGSADTPRARLWAIDETGDAR